MRQVKESQVQLRIPQATKQNKMGYCFWILTRVQSGQKDSQVNRMHGDKESLSGEQLETAKQGEWHHEDMRERLHSTSHKSILIRMTMPRAQSRNRNSKETERASLRNSCWAWPGFWGWPRGEKKSSVSRTKDAKDTDTSLCPKRILCSSFI